MSLGKGAQVRYSMKNKMSVPVFLEEVLRQVEKPGRYLGGEWNERRKNPLEVKAKVALVFPDLYEIGMSYLGQKILYSVLNDHPDILAERVFAPWKDFEQKLRGSNIPLYSLENKIPLFQFDLLGFSLLYELNYSNILTILDLGHVPFLSSQRTLEFPLVIAGGPAAFNPEPLASIFDLFLVGDGEEAFLEIIERFMELKKDFKEKTEVLRELAKIKGVYVPFFYLPYSQPKSFLLAVKPTEGAPAKIEKRVLFSFHRSPFPEKIVVPNIQIVFDRVAVEVARGCPQKCRFCQATSLYFPYRIKSPSFVIQKMLRSLRLTGYEDASLSSLSISDYPYLDQTVKFLMEEFRKEKISLSLSSLRPKGLSSEVAKSIIKVRKTGFTLVPEAGTERLRRVINKNLKDEEIWEASENAFSQGWRMLKLYFMVGLPTEKDEDLEGMVTLIKEIFAVGEKILKSPPTINISLSSFIPKPHTPFQWLSMEKEEILWEKQKFIRSCLRRYPSIKLKGHPVKNSILECVFSRGDRRLAGPLLEAWKRGARFDSWKDEFNFSLWEEAFESENLDYRNYLAPLDKEAILPWDHIETGIKKSHLLEELDKALHEESSLSCLNTKCGVCQGCHFWPRLEREFAEKIKIKPKRISPLGDKREDIFRYQAFYSKLHEARFFSHLDLINCIQRAFRRAGIRVSSSEGFHPKMLISYIPALPLGMEGKAECLEFKSQYLFSEKQFLTRVNKHVTSGLKFLRLRKVENSEPLLNEDLKIMVYSVNLESQEIRGALETIRKEKNYFSSADNFKVAQELVDEFLSERDESIEGIFLDREQGKLFLYLRCSPQKSPRPRDIVEKVFGIRNPVFLMAREKIFFANEEIPIDREK